MVSFKGSYVGVASTTVAAATIRAQLRQTIPSHPAWSLVESTTMAGVSVPCDVYKCSAAGSGLSADFYIGVMQSGALLAFGLAEGYNPVTHKPQRPAMRSSATVQPLQADGGLLPAATEIDWWTGSFNPGGGALNVTSTTGTYLSLGATTDDYLVSVAKDCIVLSVRSVSYGGVMTVGAYDSLVPDAAVNDPLPILVGVNVYTTSVCNATRHPLRGGASVGWPCGVQGLAGSTYIMSGPLNSTFHFGILGGAAADGFDFYAGGPTADRLSVQNSYTAGSATAGRDRTGWLRGSYRLLRSMGVVTGSVWGDTAQIDGVTYHLVLPSAGATGMWVELDPA